MKLKMTRRGPYAVAATCVALAIPATAMADPSQDVRKHIRNADEALALAETLVDRNKDAKAAVQMARANAQTRKADRAADVRSNKREARLTGKAARQFDENAETFVGEIGELRGAVQDDVAEEIEKAVKGRDQAVATLTGLLDRVPEQAVKGISRAIANIASGDEVEDLATAIESGEISGKSSEEVEQALERAAQSVQNAIAMLESLVGQLPPEAQSHVQSAIDRIQGSLETVSGIVDGVLGGLPVVGGEAPGGPPFGFGG